MSRDQETPRSSVRTLVVRAGALLLLACGLLAAPAWAQHYEPMEFYHYDALGSVRLVTIFPVNSLSYSLYRHDYLPFGEEIPTVGVTRVGFAPIKVGVTRVRSANCDRLSTREGRNVSRPLRLEHGGAIWHVTSRGNERRAIFRDDADRERLLAILGSVAGMYGWVVHAYVLMDNHYHLLVETREPNLAAGMRQLNGLYSQGFNRRHSRSGHLMQGRYKAILVQREAHLLELARYVVLNPAARWRGAERAGMEVEQLPGHGRPCSGPCVA